MTLAKSPPRFRHSYESWGMLGGGWPGVDRAGRISILPFNRGQRIVLQGCTWDFLLLMITQVQSIHRTYYHVAVIWHTPDLVCSCRAGSSGSSGAGSSGGSQGYMSGSMVKINGGAPEAWTHSEVSQSTVLLVSVSTFKSAETV
jgi:hypothetical protein